MQKYFKFFRKSDSFIAITDFPKIFKIRFFLEGFRFKYFLIICKLNKVLLDAPSSLPSSFLFANTY